MVPLAQVTAKQQQQQQHEAFALPELEDLLAADFPAEGLQVAHAFEYAQPAHDHQTNKDVRRTSALDTAASKPFLASQLHSLLGASASSISSSPDAQLRCKDQPLHFPGFTSILQDFPVRNSWTPEAASWTSESASLTVPARNQNVTCAGT